jgi:hypothetical protein
MCMVSQVGSNLAKAHVVSQDGALLQRILPEQELDSLPLILAQISVDAGGHFKPQGYPCQHNFSVSQLPEGFQGEASKVL